MSVERGHGNRRVPVAIAIAAAAAIGALWVIFLIGVRQLPEFPTVAEQPEPQLTGWMALRRFAPATNCVEVIDAASGDQVQRCIAIGAGTGDITFDDAGDLVINSFTASGRRRSIVDVLTGQQLREETDDVRRPPVSPRSAVRPDGARVSTVDRDDGRATIVIEQTDSAPRTLWQARGPDGYAITELWWSNRGDYVVARDTENRVVVFAVSGDPHPRVIATAAQVTWYEPR